MPASGNESSANDDDWALLARLRRDLERNLRIRLDVSTDGPRLAAGQLVARAKSQGLVSASEARELEGAVRTANYAIHGEVVQPDAVVSAANVIGSYLAKSEVPVPARSLQPKTATMRHVVPDSEGGWKVTSPNSQKSSARFSSQADAISRAREIVHKAGGGEVIIHGRDGTMRDRDTVRGENTSET